MKQDYTKIIFAVAATLFLIFGGLLIFNDYSTPERVFYKMLENNLSSYGVSKSVTQTSDGQTLVQTTQAQTGINNIVAGQTTLSQGSDEEQTSIKTESIGTLEEDFVRYTNIETSQPSTSGGDLDFTDVLGEWGRSEVDPSVDRGGELFSEAALGIVPFGYLDRSQTDELLRQIRESGVYAIDFSVTEKVTIAGRPAYIYDAEIKPELYVEMLQTFGEYVNTSQLTGLNPKNFESSPPIKISLAVDMWSRQLRSVNFIDTERSEFYTGYGVVRSLNTPVNSISVKELQQRLQAIQ